MSSLLQTVLANLPYRHPKACLYFHSFLSGENALLPAGSELSSPHLWPFDFETHSGNSILAGAVDFEYDLH